MTATRPLRIAYLAGSLDVGGAERQMLALATRLPRERFSVEFVLLTHRGELANLAVEAGIPIRQLHWTRRRGTASVPRRMLDVARLAPAIRAGHYDLVDAWMFHGYAAAAVTRPLTRVPLLVAGRRRLSDYKARFSPLERLLEAVANRASDAIVANSEAVRADAIRREHLDPRRIRVIRNGVETPPPIEPGVREAIRAAWGFGPDCLVVGSVANYKPGKGLEALIRAVAELRPDVPELRLVLVGEGPLRRTLERSIAEGGLSEAVRLHGREPDARRLYSAFDVVAHASESEGLPNVLLEAAAAGRAIVATAAGGSAEVIVDGQSGLLVPVRDGASLAAALRRVARDPDLRRQLGAAARERAATAFAMDRLVAETAALYEELAARRGLRR